LKPSFHIYPAQEYNPANAVLLMIAGTRHCSFAIMNYMSKELVEFGYYISEHEENDYKKFFEETPALNTRYHQAAIAYDAHDAVQIPSVVYKYEDGQLHLDAIYGKTIHTTVISDGIPDRNIYNVYRLPAVLHSAASWKYLSGKFWNIYTVLLKSSSANREDVMFVDFKTDEFSLVALRDNKLLLASTFSYRSPADVLYHLLKACQHLDFRQQTVKLSLSGLIEKDSAIYRELYKYFIHPEFETLTGGVKLTDELRVHPEHYYSSISKLAACVS
jgi:hypothetical protein